MPGFHYRQGRRGGPPTRETEEASASGVERSGWQPGGRLPPAAKRRASTVALSQHGKTPSEMEAESDRPPVTSRGHLPWGGSPPPRERLRSHENGETPALEEARNVVTGFVDHYNGVRLHGALGYVAPNDALTGNSQRIFDERDRKLAEARERRAQLRQAAREQTPAVVPSG